MISRRLLVAVASLAVLALVIKAPTILELRKISHTMDAYSFDANAFESLARHPKEKMSANEYLNPSFQKRYGLDMDKYLDAKGYVSPSGHHWKEWTVETKTAALLMWKPKVFTTAWRVHRAIRQIDAYYMRNDETIPVIHAVDAAIGEDQN